MQRYALCDVVGSLLFLIHGFLAKVQEAKAKGRRRARDDRRKPPEFAADEKLRESLSTKREVCRLPTRACTVCRCVEHGLPDLIVPTALEI